MIIIYRPIYFLEQLFCGLGDVQIMTPSTYTLTTLEQVGLLTIFIYVLTSKFIYNDIISSGAQGIHK